MLIFSILSSKISILSSYVNIFSSLVSEGIIISINDSLLTKTHSKEWEGDLEISSLAIMLNVKITLYQR